MKNVKIVLTSLLLVAGVIAFSSFTNKNYEKNAFGRTCYFYNAGLGEKTDPEAWSTELFEPEAFCDGPNFLCAICFDDESIYTLDETTLSEVVEPNWSSYTDGDEIVRGVEHTKIFVWQKIAE